MPTPEELTDAPELGVHFLAETLVEGVGFPTHQAVHPLFDRTVEQRSGRYGPVFVPLPSLHFRGDKLAHEIIRPALLLPSPDEMSSRLAQHCRGEARPSSAGLALRTLVARFGDVTSAVRELLCGPLRAIWIDHEQASGTKARGRYTGFSQKRIVSTTDRLAELDARANDRWLSQMERARILQSGLALKCDLCGRLEHYVWGDLGWGNQFCRYCRASLAIDPDHSPCWAPLYAVDPVVMHALRNDGLEELALVVVLVDGAKRASIALGTEWSLPRLTVESDVMGPIEGATVLGEAKSIASVEDRQIRRLAHLAERIQARRLIFATSRSDWDPGTSARMDGIQTDRGFSVESIVDLLEKARAVVCGAAPTLHG